MSLRVNVLKNRMSASNFQDDCLSQHLTVAEAMDVAANLKLGEKMSTKEKLSVTTVIPNLNYLVFCRPVGRIKLGRLAKNLG